MSESVTPTPLQFRQGPVSAIRLSRMMRSVATGTECSGTMKSCIVLEFLPSRMIQSDNESGP